MHSSDMRSNIIDSRVDDEEEVENECGDGEDDDDDDDDEEEREGRNVDCPIAARER